MEAIKERVLLILKECNLNKTEFANKLNITQSYVSRLVNKGVIPSDRLIEDICEKFGVNEDWFRYGKGPMKKLPKTFSLDEFVKSKGATDLELDIVKAYFDIEPDTRKMLVEHFKERLSAYSEDVIKEELPSNSEEFEAKYPPIHEDDSEVG